MADQCCPSREDVKNWLESVLAGRNGHFKGSSQDLIGTLKWGRGQLVRICTPEQLADLLPMLQKPLEQLQVAASSEVYATAAT